MGFAGLIEPASNSLYINRSHKLEVLTNVGQNYNLALLDSVHSNTKSRKAIESWLQRWAQGFSGLKTTFLFISRELTGSSGGKIKTDVREEDLKSGKSLPGLPGALN